MIKSSDIEFKLNGDSVNYREFTIRSGFMCPVLIVEIKGFGKEPVQYTNDDVLEITEVFFVESISGNTFNLKRCR